MEISKLKNFLVVAREGNITHAAQALHMSQPALSRQIKMLEEELGKPLFRRTQHKVVLTQTGIDFKERAEQIVRLTDLTVTELSSEDRKIEGTLSIAFGRGAFSGSIIQSIESFNRINPGVKLKMYNGGADYARMLLKARRADVLCVYVKTLPEDAAYVIADAEKRIGLVIPQEYEIAESSEIDLNDLSGVKLIVPDGMVSDRNYEDIFHQIPEGNIIASVEPPMLFVGMARRFGACVLGLEPPTEYLESSRLVFRPIYPIHKLRLILMKSHLAEDSDALEAFMDYVGRFFERQQLEK